MKKKFMVGTYAHKLSSLQKTLLIMKLALLLTIVISFQVTAAVFPQQIKLNQDTKGQTVRNVLNLIEKESNVRFFYNDDYKQLNEVVSQTVSNNSLNEVLDQVLNSTNLTFKVIENNFVVVYPKEAIQPLKISGTITDAATNESLVGVSILVEGTTNGTVSDANGRYSINITNQSAVLVFSYIGYNPEKVTLSGQTTVDVKLIPSMQKLEDVVVVGYGKSSRQNLASAVTSVKADNLNRGAISDVGQLIQGKVPGLNISASGDPNTPAAVVLRGSSTINSSNGPFYVIDGIPGADITAIAPDDIATIDILKDGAATAIYGNRASSGVIMVTTKRGKKGAMQVSYHGYVGVENVSNQLKLMDAAQLRTFVTANGQSFTPADDKGADTNWQKAIERSTAYSNSHNLSFSGGTEHNNYSASLNYINKQGILLSSNQQSVIARLAVEQTALNDKVRFGFNISNANIEAKNVPLRNTVLLQAMSYLPVSPIKNADGTYFENLTKNNYINPVALMNHSKDDTKYNKLVAGFTTNVQLPFGITYDLNISYQNYTSLHGEFYDSYCSTNYNSVGLYNNPDPQSGIARSVQNFGTNGSALRNTYQTTNKVLETYLTWNKKIGEHSFNAVIGYSWQGNIIGDGFQATSTNFPINDIGYNNLVLSNYTAVNGYKVNFGNDLVYQETRLISDFARLNYNFMGKYLLQASIRKDGSSALGDNNRWGYFPSVGGAWRIGDENFMKNLDIFNELKLRASYGVTGNTTGFNAYTSQSLSGALGTFYQNGSQVAAYGPITAYNPNLKWEKTSTTNFGLDFSILKGKIGGSIEWYDKETNDLIMSYTVDQILVPVGSIVANGGSISNKGIEVSLNFTPIETKNFSWTSNVNLSHNKNLIKSLTNPLFAGGDSTRISQPDGGGQTGSTLQIRKAGQPIGEFFTLQYAGKDANGVSQYVDHNGSLTTTPLIGTDYHYAGSPQPKILLGWANDFRYKNFDLNIFIRGVFGNKIFNATRADLFRPSTAYNTNILVDAGNESVKDVNSYKYSTRFIEDGSYVRLDNASLGYTFTNIKYIKKLRVYVSTNNLFVITKYKGIDPEINQGGEAPGVDTNNFYPKTRTFLFGVNLTF